MARVYLRVTSLDIPDGLIKQYLECLDKSDDPADTYPNVFGHVLEPIDAQEPASSSSAAIPFEEVDERSSEAGLLSDIWSLDVLPDEGPKASLLKSWDRFYNRPSAASRPPLYLSEAGNEGYDAALAHQSKHEDAYPSGRLAPTDVFLLCLFLAGLGRNSILFRYDETSGAFVKKADDARISGISLLTTTAVVDEILDCGAAMRKARSAA
ncbi:hypothetical protein KEM55_004217 [Ascosphaera atra]|nr:hypothetical protein KEM55_004217 [Ascosphaera atra]